MNIVQYHFSKVNNLSSIEVKKDEIIKQTHFTDADIKELCINDFVEKSLPFITTTKFLPIWERLLYIPSDLKIDVKYVLENAYQDDLEKYMQDVEIYFSKFCRRDLMLMNASIEQMKLIESLLIDLSATSEEYAEFSTKNIIRQLKQYKNTLLFHASVCLKLVGKGAKNYCANTLFNDYKLRKVKEQEFIKSSMLIGTDGKKISLAEVTNTSEKNLAEKLNIINTMEKMAEKRGYTWCFITITLEPKYHPNPTKGNCSYDGTSPKESAKLLNKRFNLVRAKLLKIGIETGRDYFGTSTAEAHKDGCLHKHILFFCKENDVCTVRSVFQSVFGNMNEDSFRENNGQAKATSYVFKYVTKSLTAFDKDLDILNIKNEGDDKLTYSSMINTAFRSFNSIRGVTFFGMENCLSKFRFLAKNKKRIQMNFELERIIKENDLYSFIEDGHSADIENIYIKKDDLNVFVGCKINSIDFIKRFFVLGKKDAINKNVALYTEMACLSEDKIMVLVNPNYSRNTGSANIDDWFNKIPIGKSQFAIQ